MVTIDENTVGVWFIVLDDITDFMCTLNKEGSKYKLYSRFRYSDDRSEKNWFNAELKPGTSEDKAIAFARESIAKFETMSGNKGHEILMHDGDLKEFYKELRKYTDSIASGRA